MQQREKVKTTKKRDRDVRNANEMRMKNMQKAGENLSFF